MTPGRTKGLVMIRRALGLVGTGSAFTKKQGRKLLKLFAVSDAFDEGSKRHNLPTTNAHTGAMSTMMTPTRSGQLQSAAVSSLPALFALRGVCRAAKQGVDNDCLRRSGMDRQRRSFVYDPRPLALQHDSSIVTPMEPSRTMAYCISMATLERIHVAYAKSTFSANNPSRRMSHDFAF